MAKAVGIDLGTTNSVVAVVEAGEPTVILRQERRGARGRGGQARRRGLPGRPGPAAIRRPPRRGGGVDNMVRAVRG